MNLFENFGLSQELLSTIKRLGFTQPTNIQEASIPHIIRKKDVIGESSTGSGKTLAFGCGIIEQAVRGKGIQALILAPTRELAEQVKCMLNELAQHKNLLITSIYGGVAINPQINDLKRADVVVATPGRLLDHLQRNTINLSRVNILVLDEADRMLDMGFIDDVEKIIKNCPRERQTMFFSATMPPRIQDLAHRYMNHPIKVAGTKMVDPAKLKQAFYQVPRNKKLALLIHLLKEEQSELVMVFCNTRRNTDFLVKNLKANDIKAIAIHGGLSQNKRTNTLKVFNNAQREVLICTDVAARGLDIDNVSHIYNYDIPNDSKDYVHRIGRTARAGEAGKVINLLCDIDWDNFRRILDEYRTMNVDELALPQLKRVEMIRTSERSGRFGSGRSGGRSNNRNRGPPSRNRSSGGPRNRTGADSGNRSSQSRDPRRRGQGSGQGPRNRGSGQRRPSYRR